MMIFRMRTKVLLELYDSPAQYRNLHLWRAGIRFMDPELRNYVTFCFTRQCHSKIDTPRLFLIFTYRFLGYHRSRRADFSPRGAFASLEAEPSGAFFQMLQSCVKNLFDAMKLGPPHVLHVVKSVIDMGELGIDMVLKIAQSGVVDQDPDQDGNHRWHRSQGDGKHLGVGHDT